MKNLSHLLYRISKTWLVLAVTVIFIVFCILTLPGQNALSEQYSNGLGAPDTTYVYSSSQIYKMAEAWGQQGRAAYLHARWTFDLAFPVIYTFFMLLSISWSLNRILKPESKFRWMNLIPLLAFLFDLLENSAASLVMKSYPLHNGFGEALAPVFTPIKWVFVFLGFSMVLVLFPIALIKKNAPAK